MVFQNYAIYPHLTVRQNIAFGLYTSPLSKADKAARVTEAGRMLGLEALLDRRPSALSGGQRQRVAIGRAMVRDPSVFLFDEPLSNLDAQLRAQMRIEIKRLHHRLGTTIAYVTHDQVEAMTMADRIVVMRDGLILQVGTPTELYEQPGDVFTAQFIGSPSMNLLPGAQDGGRLGVQPGGPVVTGVRPHDLIVADTAPVDAIFTASGVVTAVEPLGPETLVHFESAGQAVVATAGPRMIPALGSTVSAHAAPGTLYTFDAATQKAIGRR